MYEIVLELCHSLRHANSLAGNGARDGYGRDTETEHRVLRIPTTTQQQLIYCIQ